MTSKLKSLEMEPENLFSNEVCTRKAIISYKVLKKSVLTEWVEENKMNPDKTNTS